MFDVAPSELLIVAIVALVVIGPKDLPKALRFVGHWVGKARGMARHFRSGIDTMMREAELDEMDKKWRAHNEEIMRAYPNIDTALPPAAPSSPDGPAPEMPASYGPQMRPLDAPEPVIEPPAAASEAKPA